MALSRIPTENKKYLITRTTSGLTQDAMNIRVDQSEAESVLENFTTSSAAQEKGIQRAVDLIEDNHTNGIFREHSYLIVVVMSNGNDQEFTSTGYYDGPGTQNYINDQFSRFQGLLSSRNNIKGRFISLVPNTSDCQLGWRKGESYINFSSQVHNDQFSCSESSNNDYECSSTTPDSHDICGMDFLNLFDSVNNSVTDFIVKHKYDHYFISFQQDPVLFERDTLKVFNESGEEIIEVDGSDPNESGWKYIGWQDNHPTSYEPTIGENKSAYMIELFGDAKVVYPECLLISYDSPTYFYGYAYLSSKPLEGTIKVKKNGNLLSTDAWEYIGFKDSQNLRVQGPNNPSDPFAEAHPADYASNKYIIKFKDGFIYESGDIVEVTYDPTGV